MIKGIILIIYIDIRLILIDKRYRRTFIRKKLTDKLNLLIIKAFMPDEEKHNIGEYNCIKVNLQNPQKQNMKVTVNALEVNKITGANIVNVQSNGKKTIRKGNFFLKDLNFVYYKWQNDRMEKFRGELKEYR